MILNVKLMVINCNSNQKWNKKHHVCEKIIFGILVHMFARLINIQKVLLEIQ